MSDVGSVSTDLLQRAAGDDERAINQLFAQHRDRLRTMVPLRLNRRLLGFPPRTIDGFGGSFL